MLIDETRNPTVSEFCLYICTLWWKAYIKCIYSLESYVFQSAVKPRKLVVLVGRISKRKNCIQKVWKNTVHVQAVKYLLAAPTGQDVSQPANLQYRGRGHGWNPGIEPGRPHFPSGFQWSCWYLEMANRYLADFHGTCFKFLVMKQIQHVTLSYHQIPLRLG
jgi:hypothetical protein